MPINLFYLFGFQESVSLKLVQATFRERLFAQLIDGILLGIFSGLYFYVASGGKFYSLWVSPFFPCYLLQFTEPFLPSVSDWWWGGYFITFSPPGVAELHLAIPSPILIIVYATYYTFFHYYFGQTPGKMLKGLVVLTDQNQKLNGNQSFQRWLLYLLSLLPLGAGFWPILRSSSAPCWHDHLVGTKVWRFVSFTD